MADGGGAGLTEYRYKAFVSYSWADAAWGKWLLHALETYRTPATLVGKQGALGPVAARLIPLFKDREEEAAGASIGKAVEAALATSEFLIVICSPNSAKSKWVNHEIAWFKTHRDPERILALIVDGEPGGGEAECFPKALTHKVLPDLTITDEPEDAPLAADARDSGDGKRKARLKLAAALLGVGLDELVNRDDRRRALRQRWVTAGSLLFGGSMAALAWVAVQARNEADAQRAESDGLVEFMLTDLREKLEPVGRLDALDVVGQRALKYYAGQKPGNLDADALGRRSRALHLVGEVRDLRGDSETALVAFRQAATTTGELLARDPDNGQRIFDHAQSVFWVGYIAWQRGETKEAEAAFRDYRKYARQLVKLDPKNPDWQMEVSYAESNLGTLLYEEGRYPEAERAFATALRVMEPIAARKPDDIAVQSELAEPISWLASAREKLGRHEEALQLIAREQAIYARVLQRDPDNTSVRRSNVNALASIARNRLARGDLAATLENYAAATKLNGELLAIEPGNTLWQEFDVRVRTFHAEALFFAAQPDRARAELEAAALKLDALVRGDPKNQDWNINLRSALELNQARVAAAQGDPATALLLLERISGRLAGLSSSTDEFARVATRRQAALLAGDLLARQGKRPEAVRIWKTALQRGKDQAAMPAAFERAASYAILLRLDEGEQARKIGAELDRLDYRHPLYTRERRARR
jgi:tetratricopeptide (TPR) repeat protein